MNLKKQFSLLNRATVFSFLLLLSPEYMEASYLIREDGIKPNHSAEYVRTLNRHASCDADAAFYNPAGLAFLITRGLVLMFSNQTFYFNRDHTLDYYGINVAETSPRAVGTSHKRTEEFKSNMPERYSIGNLAAILPDVNLIWRGTLLAAYFSFNVFHATPSLKFKTGFADVDWALLSMVETMPEMYGNNGFFSLIRNQELIRDERFIGGTAGFTHKLGKYLSLAFGVRYINASGKTQIHVKDVKFYVDYGSGPTLITPDSTMDMDWNIETDTKGHGAGFIGGMHVRMGKSVNIGLRYEYYLPLLMKKKTVHFSAPAFVESTGRFDIFKDGKKSPDGMEYTSSDSTGRSELKVTYPKTLACGFSAMLLKNLKLELSWVSVFRSSLDLDGIEKNYTVGYSAGGALEWLVRPQFRISAGYVYNNTGIKPEARNPADPLLNSYSVGGGFGVKVNERLDLSLGVYNTFFTSVKHHTDTYTNFTGPTVHYMTQKYSESEFSIGTGFTLQIFRW
jgi:long-chain fatty acid transport protein